MGVSIGPAMLIGFVFMIIGAVVSNVLRAKFQRYSKIPSQHGMTGKQIAEAMLQDNNIYDVDIVCVPGQLSDHYNPLNKTVNLSKDVYYGANAAAAAVAAHECGHVLQHAQAYKPLELRSRLVPLQNASGKILNIIMLASIFGGAVLFQSFPLDLILWVLIITYGIFALFALVTLPVEFDASKRALVWLKSTGISTQTEYERSKDALKWAAMTYVVAAIGAVVTVLYYVSLLLGRRDD
ncbi:hypothetical protein SAMN05216474_2941 [Lishizhenia tianjinensis]|uniref:Zinc metallopeptidase n=1 Tax=Lishizhenia tianjinensis TaxID=477690 RepID=A0A1I7BNH5_9FLAO|nr:zinc metallopeptidase [Lishizhenia tianjinensis]SFT88754.1 hypothetical protein SAMN05216474_2941 [Lishizhenia tianjinensis]